MDDRRIAVVISGDVLDDPAIYLIRQPAELDADEVSACCKRVFGEVPILLNIPPSCIGESAPLFEWTTLEEHVGCQDFLVVEDDNSFGWRDFLGAEKLARLAWTSLVERVRDDYEIDGKDNGMWVRNVLGRMRAIAERWGLDASGIPTPEGGEG